VAAHVAKWANGIWGGLGLRRKLSLAFIVMTLAPLLLAAFVTEQEAERIVRQVVFEKNKNLATDIAHDTNHLFMEKIRVLKLLAANPEMKSMDPARQTPVLESVASQYPEIQVAVVADSSGGQLARSDGNPAIRTINYTDREYFQAAMSTGGTAISDVIQSKSADWLGIVLAEPIKKDDQTVGGLLIFNIELNNLSWLTGHVQFGDGGYAYIVNKNGRVIIHPNQLLMETMADYSDRMPVMRVVEGLTGWVEYESGGQKIMAGYSNIPSTGWGLVVEQPLKIAMADVAGVRRVNLLIVVVAALLAIVTSLVLANAIALPIEKISRAAVKVTEGDLQTRLEVESKDELGQLADNFNRMTEWLASRGAALRRSEEKFRSLVDNIDIGVYRATADNPGRFLQVNPAMVHIFGYGSAAELMRTAGIELYQKAEEREAFLAEARRAGFVKNQESLMRKQNGVLFWCSRSGVLRKDKEGREWIDGVIEDIDNRKRAEEAMHKAKEELEIQVAERTRQLTVLNEELQKLSMSDSLTCIGNRRHLDELLEREWQRAAREKTPLAVIMLDIDYFKLFNDTYGHIAGDDCLRKIATVLKTTIKRTADFVSRYGGEEFALILPATNESGAKAVAEKIRVNVEALRIKLEGAPGGEFVTVSAGVSAMVPTLEKGPAVLVQEADRALYRAKAAGRNRTMAAGEI
jgi:diguanylate cyclase (GGDEF)-like protein/PAS domain S-box-containing protein